MKTWVLQWKKTLLLCTLFIVASINSVVYSYSGKYYYAEIKREVTPSGAGVVYIKDEAKDISEANNNRLGGEKKHETEYEVNIKATPSSGYTFNTWEESHSSDGSITINKQTNDQTIKVKTTNNEDGGTAKYTLTAKFHRLKIELGEQESWLPNTPATWEKSSIKGTVAIPVTNANGINDNFSITPTDSRLEANSYSLNDDKTKLNITFTYKLPQTSESKAYKPSFTLSANPTPATDAGQTGDINSSKTYNSIDIPVDLTPTFDISPMEVAMEVSPGEEAKSAISLTNYFFPKDIIDNWTYNWGGTYKIEDQSLFTISPDIENDKWIITYHPGDNIGTHTATLTITASFTDNYGNPWTYTTAPCSITGTCDPNLTTELEIRQNGTEVSSVRHEFDMEGTKHTSFDIHSPGVSTFTLVKTGDDANQAVLTNNNKSFTVTSTTPPTAGDYITTFTLEGTTNQGTPISSKDLTITLRRWYEPLNFTATPTTNAVTLTWKDTHFATQYIVLRDGEPIAEPELNDDITTYTYTDNSLAANTDYTYTLQVLLKDGETTYATKEEVVNTHTLSTGSTAPGGLSVLTLSNCHTLLSATNVDATGAFATDGEALMDVLYIMDKKASTKCHIFTKKESSTPQYYYTYSKTLNPTAAEGRVGRIEDKKIYIAGTCESLFWNTGDYLGWMQPVNCDIYLDNARLKTAYSNANFTLFNDTVQDEESYNDDNFSFNINNIKYASVFILPEGASTIHLRGNNYIAGNMGQRANIKLTVAVKAAFQTAYRYIRIFMPNYSSPIAIKEAQSFKNNVQPNITCTFDAKWADGIDTNGYLDLSTRICQHQDSSSTKNDYIIDGTGWDARIEWTAHKGYRYASPLNTGGPNGEYIINGGRINLWPANGHAANVEVNNKVGAGTFGDAAPTLSIIGGQYANYLICGNNRWSIACKEENLNYTQASQLSAANGKKQTSSDQNIINEIKKFPSTPSATVYGQGNGIPEGHLIINGGTISANTDPNSFAYKWTDYDMTTKTSTVKTSQNVADDGSGQPLFGPNVEINGGTFLHPLYGTTNHGTGSALHKASYNRDGSNPISQWNNNGILDYVATDYKAKNLHNQSVSRTTIDMSPDAGNTDYTEYSKDITEVPNRNLGYIVNAGSEKDYQYGMMNVWSDDNSKCYFYLPCPDGSCMDKYKSYWVENNQELKQFDAGSKPYNLTVDNGGMVSIANDYRVYGRPYYRSGFKEGYYHTISMPFTVDQFSVLDPDADYEEATFTSWVDSKDDDNADNSMAYFYLYHLNDGTGAQRTTGVNDEFRSNYHTHTDGSTMQAGKTYIIKFLESGGYWEENPTIFRGAKNQTVKGKASFTFATRPTNDLEFVMDGNATFAPQNISGQGEVYLVDPAQWGNDSFHATTVSTLAPMQGYLVGSATTMQRYRIIGREGKVEQTALDQLIHTGWTAVGAHQAMLIMTPQDATAHIYTAEGKLWKTISLTANTGVVVNAPAGFYIVHTGNESKKVLVH